MKKEIWLAALGYVSSVSVLLSFLYWFLKNEGFDESTFLIGSGFVFLLSIAWGYIIASHLLQPRERTREYLLRLTRDIIHELNLPLSTIQANTAMLRRNMQEEKTQKRLKRIDDASVRLKRLYDELVYTIRKEVHQVQQESFDLKTLVEARVEIFREQQRNPIEIDVRSCPLFTDKIGFEQMFDNLVSNAMKYSPKEAPVRIVSQGYRLEVIDRGIGMDEAQLLKVYERYYQGDSRKEGEGIGLALVKTYCDEVGIEIQIDSQKGEGTRVILDLDKIVHKEFT
jgi:signal transduction histidine kinase